MTERIDPTSAMVELAPGVFAPGDAVRIQFSRSSGPGGQNVNKINSKAELWVKVSRIVGMEFRALARLRTAAGNRLTNEDEIHLRAEAERSAEANREEVFERLRQLILSACVQPKPRRKTKPSKASKQRRLDSKRRRSQIKSHRRGQSNDD
ncbi:MAG TPA: alternative ribosome rescue aminoacyl-tRNA hydrolase ArfB [Tepidisphaeraceae bacterium]|nr:alternative ribosome rescue aminoacyl-tRNA hydrolase ArfB [Tepidisphaeraceae bacterium]